MTREDDRQKPPDRLPLPWTWRLFCGALLTYCAVRIAMAVLELTGGSA